MAALQTSVGASANLMNLLRQTIGLMLLLAVPSLAQSSKDSGPYQKDATISETKDTVHVVANSPRPLEQVLEALQHKYGWVVNYEDPQYTAPQDVVNAPGSSNLRYPSGGTFTVDFPAVKPDEGKTLQLIVDGYNHSKNPGQFELRRGPENRFDVVGVAAHDEKGAMSKQSPPLDTPVTIKADDRSLNQMLDSLCQEVTKQSHVEVDLAVSPRSLLGKTDAKIGGDKVPAREILAQTIDATHHTLYWQLLYDPTNKVYFLNIHSVHVPSEAAH